VIPGVLVFFPGCGPTTTPPAAPPKTGTETTTTPAAKEKTTKGKVTKHDGDMLTVDKDHKFNIKDAKIWSDGKEVKAADIKEGDAVEVTAKGDAASKVEIAKKADVPPPVVEAKPVEGTFVSYKDDKLTIKVDDKPKDFMVKDIKPVSDGKDIKWDDFKEKDKVTVTEKDGKVTKVEKAK
jgi:ribosome maturation factor RimP